MKFRMEFDPDLMVKKNKTITYLVFDLLIY